MDFILTFLIYIFIAIPLMLFRAVILVKSWAWFIVPMGVPNVSIPQVLGINLLLGLFFASVTRKERELDTSHEYPHTVNALQHCVESVVVSFIALGMAAIFHAYM